MKRTKRTKRQLEDNNQSAHFWEAEEAETMDIGRNVIRYYPEAGRLVFHLPDWENYNTGEILPGKGVGVSLRNLASNPEVCERLIAILQEVLSEPDGDEGE